MSLSWIQLPDGYTFALENQKSVEPLDSSLVFVGLDGSKTIWQAGSSYNALALNSAIQGIMATPATFTALSVPVMLVALSSSAFDITTAALTIHGFGFTAATIGKLRFEDGQFAANEDSNGYWSQCAYVSPTEATMVYGGPGDSYIDNGTQQVVIYYEDSNGIKSNFIPATLVIGTTSITIP